ncbi:MAG: class I SAM-dependent methyltransferase [Cytophagaceae bacterium]
MKQEVVDYYNKIAVQYDDSRFANSYGKFIDRQERNLLTRFLGADYKYNVLDLGCGTGRLLDLADCGIDASEEMIKIAKAKFPQKDIYKGDAATTHFAAGTFDVVISFHVLMHLTNQEVVNILNEAHRILKTGGRIIFDVPSQKRRTLFDFRKAGWHGANDFSVRDIENFCGTKWKLERYYGILFFPIHRSPVFMRRLLLSLDNLLCRSFMKEYSSYLAFELRKL